MFEKLYPVATQSGVDAVFYWDMTYGEIVAAIEGSQSKTKLQMQFKANLVHQLGALVRVAFNEPNKYPQSAKEVFPRLFDDLEDDEPKQQNWQVMKARIEEYNSYLKRKRGETD